MQHQLQRLTWPDHLPEGEKNRLIESVSHIQWFDPGDEIVPAEIPVDFSSIILEGFSCRQKVLKTGNRQITAFNLPGDFCDLHAYLLRTLPDSAVAITACRVAIVPHERLREICTEMPRLARLLWKSTLIDASIYRQWLVCIGRQSALSRLAHLFCELYLRLAAVGLAKEKSYLLPLTQSDLSDAMGLSLVHTNRTCAALRQKGLATFARRTVTIQNWERLLETAEFEPAYLHLGNHKRKERMEELKFRAPVS
jgi:CRP-like cAMP-binding protein